jgi:hypothetical protein
MSRDFRTFILDVPHSPEELAHLAEAFQLAGAAVASAPAPDGSSRALPAELPT